MQINGPSHVHGSQPISGPQSTRSTQGPSQTPATAGADEVSISPQADLLSRISDLPEVRQDRIDEIRTQIANGTYETAEKLEIALNQLLEEIG